MELCSLLGQRSLTLALAPAPTPAPALSRHTAEIVSLNFNTDGSRIITGSFDHSTKVWDTSSGLCLHTLSGHRGEISSTQASP